MYLYMNSDSDNENSDVERWIVDSGNRRKFGGVDSMYTWKAKTNHQDLHSFAINNAVRTGHIDSYMQVTKRPLQNAIHKRFGGLQL